MTSLEFIRRACPLLAVCVIVGKNATASAQGLDVLGSKLDPNYVTDEMLLNADKDASNWLHYGRDYQSTRYSPLNQITRDNVKKLRPVWNLSFGVRGGQGSQAVVVNGTIYVTTSFNKVYSVDAPTGAVNWKYERELPSDAFQKLCCDAVNRGVAVYKNKVYLATLDAHVVALDNATGKVVWDKKIGDYTYAETFTIMPMVVRGKIIFGTAGAEYGVRGWIAAVNADNGNLVWKTYTIPGISEPGNDTWAGESWKVGGGSTEITGAYDKEANRLFWSVGNAAPAIDRHVREGDNLFTNSNLVLDPDTGKILSYFNHTPNDPYDYDGVNETILVDVDGEKLWLSSSRNGHVYGIQREVTMQGKAGKENKCKWVTALQRVNWTKPITPTNNCKPIYSWPEKDVVYDKLTTDISPSLNGRKVVGAMAYSHRTKKVYVPVYDVAMDLQAKKMEWKRGEWYLGAKVIKLNPGAAHIKAFDALTGKLVWDKLQTHPATSGLLATGGNIVFTGDSEGQVNAIDAETGESLWDHQGGAATRGITTFMAEDKQYVVVMGGEGGDGIGPLDNGARSKYQKIARMTAFAVEDGEPSPTFYNSDISPQLPRDEAAPDRPVLQAGQAATLRFDIGPKWDKSLIPNATPARDILGSKEDVPLTVIVHCGFCEPHAEALKRMVYVPSQRRSNELRFELTPKRRPDVSSYTDKIELDIINDKTGRDYDRIVIEVAVVDTTMAPSTREGSTSAPYGLRNAVPRTDQGADVVLYATEEIDRSVSFEIQPVSDEMNRLLEPLALDKHRQRRKFRSGIHPDALKAMTSSPYGVMSDTTLQQRGLLDRLKAEGIDAAVSTQSQDSLLLTDHESTNLSGVIADIGRRLYRNLFVLDSDTDLFKLIEQLEAAGAAAPLNRPVRLRIVTKNISVPWQYLHPQGSLVDAQSFWGLRFSLSVRRVSTGAGGRLPAPEAPQGRTVVFARYGSSADHTIRYAEKQEEQLRALPASNLIRVDSGADLMAHLEQQRMEISAIFAFLHAKFTTENSEPQLLFNDGDIVTSARLETLLSKRPPKEQHQTLYLPGAPLVILNGCETGPSVNLPHVSLENVMFQMGAQGVLVTEVSVWITLGHYMATRLIDRLGKGEPISDALTATRRELYAEKKNPLGLLYVYYGDPEAMLRH